MVRKWHYVLAGTLLALAFARSVEAQAPASAPVSPPVALLHELDKDSIDPGQIYALRHARLSRGGASFYFDRGFIGFLRPVRGEVTGAVFAGDGEVLLMPPDPVEKLSLAEFTGAAVLEERFDLVYMRFTGHEAQELLRQSQRVDPRDPEQPGDFAGHWNPLVEGLNPIFSLRVLEDLLGERDMPLFAAQIEGLHLGMFNVADDERLPEAVNVMALKKDQGLIYHNVWCSYASPTSRRRAEALEMGAVRPISYNIHTKIDRDDSLEARTVVELESRSSRDRVLTFKLAPQLHVVSVTGEKGRALPLLSPSRGENKEPARNTDWVAVVLPAPYPAGTRFRLTFKYAGNVITNAGNGVLYVGAHESWYPNRGFDVRAPYVLTFQYPDTLKLVATGQCVEESSAEGWTHSRWVSDGPFPVAGFNLGTYEKQTERVGNVRVEVYATRDAETALVRQLTPRQIPLQYDYRMRAGAEASGAMRSIPPPPVVLDPAAALGRVAKRAAAAIRYFQTLFGPFPYPTLALSQIPGKFGQGWPGLVYLPTFSFFVGGEGLGPQVAPPLQGLEEQLFVSHEIAHQWWGNELGWKTYHDRWLSEGFASYAAALELAQGKDGSRKFYELLRQYKQDLLSKTPEGKTVEAGGPIWLGTRLTNSLNPHGYDAIVYKKSCWVLHMLHYLMTDPKTGSDKRFFAMLREFEKTYRGQSPSTKDFIEIADRYMTPEMDLDHNRRLEWFFSDWVYGTGIPAYKVRASTVRLKNGRFLTTGTIQQSGVRDGFEMLVPLVARAGREKKVDLGRVAVGPTGHFRRVTSYKPSRITVDEDEVLAQVD